MAIRRPDGTVQMSDGRILYADSTIIAQDVIELIPLFVPPAAWPFVSGGGSGGAGTPGARGIPGAQGPQGTNPGVQGPQGISGPQGNQGTIASNFTTYQFGHNSSVPGSGTLQLEGPGTSQIGFRVLRAGVISGGSINIDLPSPNDYELEIRVNGLIAAVVPLPSGSTSASSAAFAAPVIVGDIVDALMVRTSGSGASTFNSQHAVVEISV